MSSERRRAPRARILGRLHGRLVALDADVEIRELSLGGMSVLSDIPFPVDAIHQFDLFLGDGARVSVVAQARHSQLVEARTSPRYLTGFEFIDDEAADQGVGAIVSTLG
ncbi:MAG TPA: PilZ domain-containing protein [Vicinamibacterales bacterium]|nr:PilZ domain-containing protein [Vicinamibacterales bacterium]